MRKKELIKLNEELFNRHQATLKQLEEVIAENKRLTKSVEELKANLEEAQLSKEKEETPLKNLEEKIISNASITDETKYGAEIIGKIVVSAAKHCNALTSSPESGRDVKELVNLILGRTEIAKAEILNIVENESEFLDKKGLIEAQLNQCEDYFDSIMAQN